MLNTTAVKLIQTDFRQPAVFHFGNGKFTNLLCFLFRSEIFSAFNGWNRFLVNEDCIVHKYIISPAIAGAECFCCDMDLPVTFFFMTEIGKQKEGNGKKK